MAVAYIDGKEAAIDIIRTPEGLDRVEVVLEEGVPEYTKDDMIFAYAKILDRNGTIVPLAENEVSFQGEGSAELVGQNPVKAEAGVAAILVKIKEDADNIKITAKMTY